MIVHPAVIVHGLADAQAVLAVGAPVTLLSAPGAAIYAGCLWWRELVAAARRGGPPDAVMTDVLDCGDAPGQAMAALRSGVPRLVLAEGPAWAAVAQIARHQGGFLLQQAPPALDMADRRAPVRLCDWLRPGTRDAAVDAG
ncbi:MAG: hypothetical protein U1E70_20055 [Acetobacteraceae bacterium]